MDVEDENLELKLELASSRAEGEKLRSQLENSTKQLERLSRSEADLINQLNVATKVIGDNRIDLDDLTFRIGSADVEIKLYKNELQDLRNKLLVSEKEAKSLREQVEDLKSGAYITRTQTESSINFRLSASYAQGEDEADFGVGHDLIHDHDHQEKESKIKGLEKLVEELHASLHSAEEENGTLRTMLEKTASDSARPNEVVDSVINVKADMAAQLVAKDAEVAALKTAHEEELYHLRVSKEEEIHALRASTNEELARLQKAVEELEAEKAELQQHYDMLSAKQEYLAQTVPSSFTKPSELTISTNDSVGIGANPNRSSREIVSSQTSLERAVQLYVKEGKNDDVLQEMNNLVRLVSTICFLPFNSNMCLPQVTKFEKLKTRNTLLLNKLQSARGNIQVCCRTRPASNEEFGAGGKVIVDGHDESELSCYDWKVESWKPFGFDHVWPPEATQADVFSDVEPLIASVAGMFVSVQWQPSCD
jgi:chromosome segregation ATPase